MKHYAKRRGPKTKWMFGDIPAEGKLFTLDSDSNLKSLRSSAHYHYKKTGQKLQVEKRVDDSDNLVGAMVYKV